MKNLGLITDGKDLVTKEYVDARSRVSDIVIDTSVEQELPIIANTDNVAHLNAAVQDYTTNGNIPTHIIIDDGTTVATGTVLNISTDTNHYEIEYTADNIQSDVYTITPGKFVYDNNTWTLTTYSSTALDDFASKAIYGDTAINLGRLTNTNIGTQSTAEGYNTTASNSYTHAEGDTTIASGNASHAEGNNTIASGNSAHAEGDTTTASGNYSHSEGWNTQATGAGSHTEGQLTFGQGANSHVEGHYNLAIGQASHVEGGGDAPVSIVVTGAANATTYTVSDVSIVHIGDYLRYNNKIVRITSISTTNNTITVNATLSTEALESISVGKVINVANGKGAHAEGRYTTAQADYSHTEGVNTKTTGVNSHAEGDGNTTSGVGSHAEGKDNVANGNYSHVEGQENTAGGVTSHVEGYKNTTSGNYSHAEGNGNTVTSMYGHAEGYHTQAITFASTHAEGNNTTASGSSAHAEGDTTIASGNYSHSEGSWTTASGKQAHAEGYHTTAQRKSQHVEGEFNIADTTGSSTSDKGNYIHIAGNGTNNTAQSNAYTLDWSGNGWFAGDVYVGSISGTNKDAGSKKLATEEYVDTHTLSASEIDVTSPADTEGMLRSTNTTNEVNLVDYVNSPGTYTIPVECYIYTDSAKSTDNRLYAVAGDVITVQPQEDDGTTVTTAFTLFSKVISIGEMASTDSTTWTSSVNHYAYSSDLIGKNLTGNEYIIDEETYTASDGAEIFNDYRERGTMTDPKYQMELKTGNIATGVYSHAEGMGNNVLGSYSHAEGCNTTSNGGYGSHAEGLQTQANGEGSHAEGEGTQANGVDSHAEGISATAEGAFAHAEGNGTTANGESSHAEGFSCTASEFASHAEGESTYTDAAASHVEGKHTIASCIGQHVEGQYNIKDENGDYAHIVGNGYWDEKANNGEGEEVRSNAHTLDWSGNAWYKGTLKVGGTNYSDANTVATEDYVSSNYIAEPTTEGTAGQVLTTDGNGGRTWTTVQGGGGGTSDYTQLTNKPQINSVTLTGNKSLSDLGIAAANEVINATDLTVTNGTVNLVDYVNTPGIYKVPSNCIMYTDSASSTANKISALAGDIVKIAPQIDAGDGEELVEFDSYFTVFGSTVFAGAMVTADNVTWTSIIASYENQGNKVTTISSNSGDTQYPSAKAVYDYAAQKSLYGDTTINVGRASNSTVGTHSTAVGYSTTASGNNSCSEGFLTSATGTSSHAEGGETVASGNYAHAEGQQSLALNSSSHSEGNNNAAFATYSHAEGRFTISAGSCSHSEGGNNTALTIRITGDANATTYTTSNTTNAAIGKYIKYSNTIRKITAIVTNTSITVDNTLSSSALSNANASIYAVTASGSYSHAEGQRTTASGNSGSHAEGCDTVASATYSHSEGYGTIAQRKSQHVQGEYNVADTSGTTTTRGKYADIVGNGTSDSARSNAYTLDWDGNGCFAGDVYVGATDKDDANAKKLATEEYVDSLVLDGAQKTILYNGKATDTAVLSGNIQELSDSIFNYDLIVVGFNCLVQNASRSMEICDTIYPNSSLITWCDTTGTGATGAHHIFNSNQAFNNCYRIIWGFTDATHIRNIVSAHVATGTYGWVDEGICYVVGYKFSALPDGYIQEPTTEGTSGQVLTTDGQGGRTWTTVSGGGSGTSDYTQLTNKPQINSVTLTGNVSLSTLGAASEQYVDDKITYGTTDLTAGTSQLTTGTLYFVYE